MLLTLCCSRRVAHDTPLSVLLTVQVLTDYDMDEQDEQWLGKYNVKVGARLGLGLA